MPHDPDEKPPPPAETPPAFDFNTRPRWRSKLFPAPDGPPAESAPQKPVPAPARETAPEFDTDNLPLLRPQFRLTPDDLGAKRTLQKPAPTPSPRKTTGEDWRAQTLAQRANQPPPRADEPASGSESALRAFLDTDEADAQIETPLAEDEHNAPRTAWPAGSTERTRQLVQNSLVTRMAVQTEHGLGFVAEMPSLVAERLPGNFARGSVEHPRLDSQGKPPLRIDPPCTALEACHRAVGTCDVISRQGDARRHGPRDRDGSEANDPVRVTGAVARPPAEAHNRIVDAIPVLVGVPDRPVP